METNTMMDEARATAIADAIGGEPWQSGGDIWVVLLRRADGSLVVISDECVCEYENDEAFDAGESRSMIAIR